MSENPCEHKIEDARQATEKYILWFGRAILPSSLYPLDPDNGPIVITQEMWENLETARKQRDVWKKKWLQAMDAMDECVKSTSK